MGKKIFLIRIVVFFMGLLLVGGCASKSLNEDSIKIASNLLTELYEADNLKIYENYLSLKDKNKENPEIYLKEYINIYNTLVDDSMFDKLMADGMIFAVDQIAYDNKANISVKSIDLIDTDSSEKNTLIYQYKVNLVVKRNNKESETQVTGIIQLKKYDSDYKVDYIKALDIEPIYKTIKELS